MRTRCEVELHYVLALDKTGLFTPLTLAEKQRIEDVLQQFQTRITNGSKRLKTRRDIDVKACVKMFLREKIKFANNNLIHFALTSEDVNNLAYNILLKKYLEREHLPLLKKSIRNPFVRLRREWPSIPFPARTHGQKASANHQQVKKSPVIYQSPPPQYRKLKDFQFAGKLNGAGWNFSAMIAAFPEYD